MEDGLEYTKKTEIDDLAIEVDYRLNNVNVREEYEYTHAHIFGKPLGMVIAINTMGNGRVSVSALSTGFSYKLKKGQLLDSLNNFIKNNNVFSKGKIVEMGCGAQSVSPLKKFTADGIMLVGDAAHQTNLPHACGVLNTMDAGEMAGEAAVEAHEEEDFSYNILSRYEKRWYGLHGEHNFVGSTLLKILSAFAR